MQEPIYAIIYEHQFTTKSYALVQKTNKNKWEKLSVDGKSEFADIKDIFLALSTATFITFSPNYYFITNKQLILLESLEKSYIKENFPEYLIL